MQKALVIGGNGFIGSWVTKKLIEKGYAVKIFTKENTPLDNVKDLDIEIVYGNILNKNDLSKSMADIDYVFHLAALHTQWLPDFSIMYKINVDGTENVAQACLDNGIKRLIYTSTQNTIGFTEDGIINEEVPFNYHNFASHYTLSKYYAQVKVLEYVKKGLDCVILNPSGPFGEGDIGPGSTGKVICNVVNEKYPFYFEGMFNAIDVEDVATAHVLAIEKGKTGNLYLIGHQDYTLTEFFELICELTGASMPKIKIPKGMALFIAKTLEFVSNKITKKPPLLTSNRITERGKKRYLDCSKALKRLDYPLTPIKMSLTKAIKWFIRKGYIKKHTNFLQF